MWMVGAVGVTLIFPNVIRLKESAMLSREGVTANAEVVGLRVHNFDQGGTSGKVSRMVYQWRVSDKKGNKTDVPSQYEYSYGWFEPYNEDNTMPIIYNPENTNINRINTWFNRWGRDCMKILFFSPLIWLGLVSLLPEAWINAHRNFWEWVFTKKSTG